MISPDDYDRLAMLYPCEAINRMIIGLRRSGVSTSKKEQSAAFNAVYRFARRILPEAMPAVVKE